MFQNEQSEMKKFKHEQRCNPKVYVCGIFYERLASIT